MLWFLYILENEQEQQKVADIFKEYEQLCYRIALKFTKNPTLAEDAVQSTFLSIIKNKEKFLHLKCRDLHLQIVFIVKNKAIDIMRNKHNSNISFDDVEDCVKSSEDVEEKVLKGIEYEELKKHISLLDEISKQVLQMKYILGMSYKEIGIELNMTPK
ncbi:MAG: sigma-70 family RNA polymerase sigma factor, partial [Oscillospiraceae bacterium]|nr:sigma-70 family RNA polymerase sigma factor [Oscillospiraceae bacterium]